MASSAGVGRQGDTHLLRDILVLTCTSTYCKGAWRQRPAFHWQRLRPSSGGEATLEPPRGGLTAANSYLLTHSTACLVPAPSLTGPDWQWSGLAGRGLLCHQFPVPDLSYPSLLGESWPSPAGLELGPRVLKRILACGPDTNSCIRWLCPGWSAFQIWD